MEFVLPSVATRIVVAVVFSYIIKVIQRAYFTPLRKVPGPWYARLTHLVLKYHVITGNRCHYIHSLHLQYGPIVLVAPTEVVVSSLPAFRIIHSFSKPFLKSPWYQSFVPGFDAIFTMIDPKAHVVRRKLFAQGLSKSFLKTNWEDEVRKKVEMAIDKIKRDALRGETDILKWFTFMAADVVGHLSFGESPKTLENEKTTQYTSDVQKAAQGGGIRSEFPIPFAIGKFLNIPFFIVPDDRIFVYGYTAVKNARSTSAEIPTLFRKILSESTKENANISDQAMQQEAGNIMVAGTDTTAITITYLIYSVLQHPELQQRLEDEMQTLPEGFKWADVEKLEFLNAVIEETLRLFGAAPGFLPRTVPKGGCTLEGYFLPEDITVGTQAYTIHRDPTIFPSPESFQPSRWLSSECQTEDFKTANHPFGAGTRTCVGVHLARMELLFASAMFFRDCKGARIAKTQSEEGMELENFFLVEPKGRKCDITMMEGH